MRLELFRPRWLWISGALLTVLGLAAFIGWRYYDPGWRYEVRGIDVSHHQGPIDWPAVAAEGVAFAYIKATEGGDWVDTRFAENWEASGEAGLLRGAYHFFTLCRPGLEQADHLIATVPREAGMLPPAIDLEFGGNCAARPTVAEFRAELDAFLARVSAHYETRLVAYTNAHFYDVYLDDDPPDVTWWIASTLLKPWGDPEWVFWQYFPGRHAGVDGAVDRNVFRHDLEQLAALALD